MSQSLEQKLTGVWRLVVENKLPSWDKDTYRAAELTALAVNQGFLVADQAEGVFVSGILQGLFPPEN